MKPTNNPIPEEDVEVSEQARDELPADTDAGPYLPDDRTGETNE